MKCNLLYFGDSLVEARDVLDEMKTVFEYKIVENTVYISFELDGIEITDKLEWENAQYRIELDVDRAKKEVKNRCNSIQPYVILEDDN